LSSISSSSSSSEEEETRSRKDKKKKKTRDKEQAKTCEKNTIEEEKFLLVEARKSPGKTKGLGGKNPNGHGIT
jgi:hypothetical protein